MHKTYLFFLLDPVKTLEVRTYINEIKYFLHDSIFSLLSLCLKNASIFSGSCTIYTIFREH